MFSQFDQVEYCNVDSDNLDRNCFILFQNLQSDFLSNKALLLPDLQKKIEDLVDKTALIKSLKDKIDEPSPIRGNKFSHLSLEDFKETGEETFAWESFEKKLSAYSFLKYLVQENDIQNVHVDLPGLKTFLSFSETDTEKSVLFN